jgi:hypothetical protein
MYFHWENPLQNLRDCRELAAGRLARVAALRRKDAASYPDGAPETRKSAESYPLGH